MLKKIILTLFISYGLFQLFDVNYRMGHEGVGLLETLQPESGAPSVQSVSAVSSSASSAMVESNLCGRAGFALNPIFTSGINARLPELLLSAISPKRDSAFYFTELIGVKTPVVEFRWVSDGVEFHRELFEVKGMRWRAWSSAVGLSSDTRVNKNSPLAVEIWADQCLIHSDKIVFAEDEKAIHLDQAASYFDYYNTTLGHVSPAYQYSKDLDKKTLVYRFDSQRLNPRIYIDIESKIRDEFTQDVFTQYVMRDEALPLPLKAGGAVMNYSDININRKTTSGDTVLLEAIKQNSRNTIKSLLAIGANPFIRDAEKRSPLDLAMAAKDRELIDLLVEHMFWGHAVGRKDWSHTSFGYILGADNYSFLKRRNRLGETSLMRAAASGDEFAIIGLSGMKSNSKDAFERDYLDPYEFDYAGRQAVDIARDAGYKGAELLLEKAMEQMIPAWASYRMLIASELEGDIPTKCFNQAGKRIWLLATLVDMPIKKVKLVWSVSKEYNGKARAVKTEEFLTTSTEYQLKRFIDPEDLGENPAFIHADLYFNDERIRNASFTNNYANKSETKCNYYDNYPKNSLKKQFAAWVPLNVVSKRAAGFDAERMRVHQALLEDAVAYESPSLLGYLFNAGLKPGAKYFDKSLLRSAVSDKKLALTQHLLAEGEDLVAVDAMVRKGKQSLMTRAVYNHDETMVKFLVGQGLPVNENDPRITQPLIEALESCDAKLVEVLLKLGANPFASAVNRGNKTAWEYAAEQCTYEPRVMEVLNSTK
ncbi:MAG TPA: hypothetical protein DIW64_02545 [Cellvibrio sp.]|nr:hypothetical protein [Cellvibrio sp.]